MLINFLACSNVERCIEVLGVGEQAIVVGLCCNCNVFNSRE